MQIAGGTVAAGGFVRHVRAVENAVAQPVRQAGRSQFVIATGLGRARRTDVTVIGQPGTIETVPEFRRDPLPATGGEQLAAVFARQYHLVLVELVVRFAGRL